MRKMFSVLVGLICLSACTHEKGPDPKEDAAFEKTATIHSGFVKRKREMVVKDDQGYTDNLMGLFGGGVAGVLLANPIGHGAGTVVAKVAGGIGGAFIGVEAEKWLRKHNAVEYIVELDDGKNLTVLQTPQPVLHEGQKVIVYVQNDGRAIIRTPPQ